MESCGVVQTGAGALQWQSRACGAVVQLVLLTLRSRASGRWGLRDPILTRTLPRWGGGDGGVAPILIREVLRWISGRRAWSQQACERVCKRNHMLIFEAGGAVVCAHPGQKALGFAEEFAELVASAARVAEAECAGACV